MTLRPLLLSALVLCAPLAACDGSHRGIETAHQPVVSHTSYAIDLLAGPDGLAGGEAQRLRGWLDTLAAGYGDTLTIDDPAGSVRVREDVAAVAGLPLSAVAIGAPLSPGAVRVTVIRSSAAVPSCATPAANASLVNFDAHLSSGFGCAVNGNLAAMVANPDDLLRGRVDDGHGRAATAAKAVSAWRKTATTGNGGTAVKNESTGGR